MLSNAKIETIPIIMQVFTAINKVLSHFFSNSSRNKVSRMILFVNCPKILALAFLRNWTYSVLESIEIAEISAKNPQKGALALSISRKLLRKPCKK